jgi:hypothetical protein
MDLIPLITALIYIIHRWRKNKESRLTDLSTNDLHCLLLPAGEESRSDTIISIEIRLDIFVQEGGLSSGRT